MSCRKSVYAQWAHRIDTASECFFVRRHIGEGFLVETAPPVGYRWGSHFADHNGVNTITVIMYKDCASKG